MLILLAEAGVYTKVSDHRGALAPASAPPRYATACKEPGGDGAIFVLKEPEL
jgi:hypothetical protein